MSPTRPLRTLVACLLAGLAVLAVTGCGTKGSAKNPVREGIAVDISGLKYNVFITRELNPTDAEDKAYYQGDEETPECVTALTLAKGDSTKAPGCPTNLYGVFIQVCNEHGGDPLAATIDGFKIVDSQGKEYRPLPLPKANLYAYQARTLTKGDCIPEAGSTAATAPIGGSILVFRLPVQTTENRPLELEVTSAGKSHRFELDL
ncbi:MAG: hypothetical protein QOJ07_1688 [Thermoleophilaceae bacterium]|jgi:hypothetical protein|nr:hypothetical protein [Thermoleophilaceae bacterium]